MNEQCGKRNRAMIWTVDAIILRYQLDTAPEADDETADLAALLAADGAGDGGWDDGIHYPDWRVVVENGEARREFTPPDCGGYYR